MTSLVPLPPPRPSAIDSEQVHCGPYGGVVLGLSATQTSVASKRSQTARVSLL